MDWEWLESPNRESSLAAKLQADPRMMAALGKSLDTARFARALMDEYRREHRLPSSHDPEKIQRYEAHLSRQFHVICTNFDVFKPLAWGIPSPPQLQS